MKARNFREIKLYSWEQNISSIKSRFTLNRNLLSWNISMKLRYFREVMIFFREIKLYSWEHNIFSWNHISLTKSHNLRWITMFFVKSHDSHHFREITYYLLRNHTICVDSQCFSWIHDFSSWNHKISYLYHSVFFCMNGNHGSAVQIKC